MKFDEMKEFMDQLTAWKIPGNSIVVYHQGEEVFSYQSGYADLEQKIPMSPEHLINIYSCSKVTTVTSALQLLERGVFRLDDPVYSILPEYKELYVRKGDGVEKAKNVMTFRHLFTMTSGLTYDMNTKAFDTAREETEGRMDTRTLVRHLAKDVLAFEPGTEWRYSLSHDVLACVVEEASGIRFKDYVKQNIFEPLGMNESLYHNESVRGRMAEQYCLVNDSEKSFVDQQMNSENVAPFTGTIKNVGKGNSFIFGPEYDSGGAGITTSVRDYAKLCNALANRGVGRTGERILCPETIEMLRQNQLSEYQLKFLNSPQLAGYGYGLGMRTLISKEISGSNGNLGEIGWGGAAGASVLIDTDERLAMFYSHHMLNPQEWYYQPRIRNVLYNCLH